MAQKIVLFADGTGNAFSTQESNVWRLSEALDASDGTAPLYLAGVGTSSFKPWALLDDATGFGVPGNVRALYTFLCENWEDDSKIYMFGFSRGAFTIRTLIGLIDRQGIIPRRQVDNAGNVTEIGRRDMERYAADAYLEYRLKCASDWSWQEKPPAVYVAQIVKKLVRAFHRTKYETIQRREKPSIEFVGLFDTVEAYGVPIDEMRLAIDRLFWPISFRNGKMSAIAKHVCHALSLDDERTSFHPLRIEPAEGESRDDAVKRIKEVWFAGAHSDVGGGYPDGALSYVPLMWMLDELNKTGGGLKFLDAAERRWRTEASAFAPRHDARSLTGALYRYAPRSAQIRSRYGEALFDPPVVHHSVVERIAFGNDRYAPTPLTKDARVQLPNGVISNILSATGTLPPGLNQSDPEKDKRLERPYAALSTLDGPKQTILEKAEDMIWWRRVMYFVMIAFLGFFLALPAYADALSDVLCDLTSGWPFADLWLRAWEGFGSAISPIVGAIVPNVAGYVGPHLQTLREHPAIFLNLLIAIVALYLFSGVLAKAISDITFKAWTKHGAKADGDISFTGRCMRWLRTNEFSKGVYSVSGNTLMPAIWGVVLVLLLGGILSRVVFDFRSGANIASFCPLSDKNKVRAVGDTSVDAITEFQTKSRCWPSGLAVTKGQKYLLTLSIKEPWVDRTIVTDASGFEAPIAISEAAFIASRPLLRWAFAPWFHPIARIIGNRGAEEWSLQFRDANRNEIKAAKLVDNAKCSATPKRYDNSPEFCEAHGFKSEKECAAFPLKIGLFEPLNGLDLKGVRQAFESAANRSQKSADCGDLPKTRKIFTAEFEAHTSGELFLFVNDAMPILGFLGDFYANNLGSATISVQRLRPGESETSATIAKAETGK